MPNAKVARPDASLVRTSVSRSSRQARESTKRVSADGIGVTFPKGAKGISGPEASHPQGQMNSNVQVSVLSKHGTPLMPCHPARARELLKGGRAVVVRRSNPFVIRLKDLDLGVIKPTSFKIDPGSKHTGLAIAREDTTNTVALWLAELDHRGNSIKDSLKKRSGYRRRRRSSNLRYRSPRFSFRTKPKGWLAPSLQHRIDSTLGWFNRLRRWFPINQIAIESVRFDTQLMENPNISGVEYQQGSLQGYEIREYLLERGGRKCTYCSAENIPLEIDHVISKAFGGTNRVSNLVMACHKCNQKKGSLPLEVFLKGKPEIIQKVKSQLKNSLKDAAAVNITRWPLVNKLRDSGLPIRLSSGGMTKYNRFRFKVPKTHALDALCVGTMFGVSGLDIRTIYITSKGRGSYQRSISDAYGFARGRTKDSIGQHRPRQKRFPDRKNGFATGDFVKATSKDKRIEGRIKSVRSKGSFTISDIHSGKDISATPKNCILLSRSDGYSYK